MEELSIEKKAKAYDEALDRAKKLKETCDSTAVVGWCEYIFPELCELEDERIRKELIENVTDSLEEEPDCIPNSSKVTVGTKIRSKANPDVILSIISDDCHEDEFECSNGSVLSLKQIEKYYDIIK